jgi:hypothetical protein
MIWTLWGINDREPAYSDIWLPVARKMASPMPEPGSSIVGKDAREPVVLPDGTEVVIVGGVAFKRLPKEMDKPVDETTGGEGVKRKLHVRRSAPLDRPPEEPPEAERLLKEAETLFIEGDLVGARAVFEKVLQEHGDTPSAAKAREYIELLE